MSGETALPTQLDFRPFSQRLPRSITHMRPNSRLAGFLR